MKKSKGNRGITLITVIIAIIIMAILVTVSVYSGVESYRNAKVTQFVTKMQLIQTKVDELVDTNEYSNLGSSAATYQNIITIAYNQEEISTSDVQNFKYFGIDDLKDDMELENIDTDVLINFTTREIVSVDGVEYKGKTYYTQYKLPQGQELVFTNNTREGNIDFTVNKEMDGLNCLIRLTNVSPNCKLLYGEGAIESEVSEWKTISNYTRTREEYTVNITKTGTYLFKIQDNNDETSTSIKTVLVVTTNSPKTEVDVGHHYDYANNINHWSIVDGNVWIPRFAYNKNDNTQIKFIKGNSNIATDNTYIDLQNWIIPSIFSGDTGKWISESLIELYMAQEYYNVSILENDVQKIQYLLAHRNFGDEQQVNETSRFEKEIFNKQSETIFDENNRYLIPVIGENNDEPIRLFSDENVDKNFIISFNKISIVDDGTTYDKNSSPTLLGSMDEGTKYGNTIFPGFNVKLMTKNGTNQLVIESNSFVNTDGDVTIPNDVTNIRILRLNGILYYSLDRGKFIKLNDYSNYRENLNPFDAPLIFGAGLDANGNKWRFFKGIISDVSVKFIDDGPTIDDYNPPLKTVYAHEGKIKFIPTKSGVPNEMINPDTNEKITDKYGNENMIYTGLDMFGDEASLDRNFEISFVIEEIESGNVNQAAIVNAKYEKTNENNSKSWPGFVFRLLSGGSIKLDARCATGTGYTNNTATNLVGHKITISRVDRKVYIQIDDGTQKEAWNFTNFSNLDVYFHVPITIGGSLNNEGVTNQPFRGFKGTLSNIVVKVED